MDSLRGLSLFEGLGLWKNWDFFDTFQIKIYILFVDESRSNSKSFLESRLISLTVSLMGTVNAANNL